MLYELRFYKVPPGRMGGHDERHEKHLPAIFARHGIICVGRWSAVAGPDLPIFAYLTIYPDFAERQRQWADFYADDEWWRVRAATNGKTELVDQYDVHFLTPNPLWRPLPDKAPPAGGIHQLLFVEVGTGKIGDAVTFLRDVWIPKVIDLGGSIMMVADFLSGEKLPRMAIMVAWPDADRLTKAARALDRDDDVIAAQANERERYGRSSLGRTVTYCLDPMPYGVVHPTLGLGETEASR
jgi:hypothetical protein